MVYAKDTKSCSNANYANMKDKNIKVIYKTNNKVYQFLIMSCIGIAFGLVNQAKTKTLINGKAFLAWKNLAKRYAPHSTLDLIQRSGEFNKCALKDSLLQ